jgi:NADH dehydrogenase [ubiquinone] 1 alpha subcomplex assembly factor 5
MSQEPYATYEIFDRKLVKLHRERAARALGNYEFLFREVAQMLTDRLSDVRRGFPLALDVGCHTGQVTKTLKHLGKINTILQCDLSEQMLRQTSGLRFAADEELLPVGDGMLDLVISCLSLHWVNDLPGCFIQMRKALKEDGLFLVALFGGETLKELRQSLMAAETKIVGGAGPRVSPFADIRDGGALLQRAGFALPVVDTDLLTVSYKSPLELMRDLRGMGEQMSTYTRQKTFTRREVLFKAADIYQNTYGDSDGRVPATFEIITLTAWAPSSTQPQPLTRGSGKSSLADALGSK